MASFLLREAMRMIIITSMLKLTAHRKTILEHVNASDTHWDAEELARSLADSGKSIGIATVYRGLAALEGAGLISSIQFGGRKRYERANKQHHDHLLCTACGVVEEFMQPEIETLQAHVAASKDFQMTGHQLLIYGLCSECRT